MLENRKQFSVAIACRKCGEKGEATWEAALPNLQGPDLALRNLPDGFFQRVARNVSPLPEIVCDVRGAAPLHA